MKVRLKILSLFLALVFVIASFAGCGGVSVMVEPSNSENVDTYEIPKNFLKPDSVYSSSNSNAIQGITTKTNSSGGKNVNYNPTASSTSLVLESSNTAQYKIVKLFSGTSADATINTFATDLKNKTGATFTVNASNTSIGGKQIVIGYASTIKSYAGDFAFKTASAGTAIAKDGTIYIGVGTLEALPLIFDYFLEQVKVISGNDYGVTSNLKISADLCAISEHIPLFTSMGTGSSPTNKGLYSAGGGNYQQTYTGSVFAVDVKNYNDKLIAAGYSLNQQNTMNSNSFYTFIKGDTMVHINWFATISQYSIVYGPRTYSLASSRTTNYQKLVDPSISQMALYNTGQCNVIQLEDGRFVIIDSGRAKGTNETENHDAEILFNFLNSKKPSNHAKPKVIWMFTHAHSDHVNMARDNFFTTYKNQIELQLVLSNFPDFTVLDKYLPSGATWGESAVQSAYANTVSSTLNSAKNNFPAVEFYTFHTGEIIYLPGCEIEIIHTQEDYYLNGFKNVNDTSCAFKITMKGRSFMVYGDTTARVNDHIYKRYENYLKVDILQVSHHGVNDFMSLDLVKASDPDICLWPVRNAVLTSDRVNSSAAYSWLKAEKGSNGQRKRIHYSQNHTVTVSIPSMTITTKQWYSGGKSDSLDGRTYLG